MDDPGRDGKYLLLQIMKAGGAGHKMMMVCDNQADIYINSSPTGMRILPSFHINVGYIIHSIE